jgi:integrase
MAHISRRQRNGKVTYLARYPDPSGRERAKSFTRKKDAERFLTRIENDKLRGTWTDPVLGRVHLADWYAQWRRATVELRPNTEARDERLFRLHILPRFGPMPLAAITQYEVRAWVTHTTRQGLAASTVRRAYQLLGKVLGAAVDNGMIAQNPCRRVPLPRIERREMRFLTPAEVARLADSIRPGYRALVLLGAYGGLRIGEMAGLRRGRVDLERGIVEVAEIVTEVSGHLHFGPPKTRAGYRRVGLPRVVVEALAEQLAHPGSADDLVFVGPQGGTFRLAGFRHRIWRPATRAAGLDGLRIHDLRHTAVALWIAAGANPKEVAARAGHTSVSFTLDRYGHLYPDADQALRDRLDALHALSQAAESAGLDGPETDQSASSRPEASPGRPQRSL